MNAGVHTYERGTFAEWETAKSIPKKRVPHKRKL